MSDEGISFADFEAAANAGKEPEPVTIEGTATVIDEKPKADEPLELTEGDEAVDVPEGEEGGEEEPAAEEDGKKRRSKPAAQRIAELTAKLREAERRLEASGKTDEPGKALDKPDPADFEFGDADPAYIDKLTDWKIESREAEKAKAEGARNEQRAMSDRLNLSVAKAEAEAKEKYADFDDRIAEAVEARAGEPLPPLLTIGIGISPVGGDIIYRLATDEAASARLEKLASGGQPKAMALALGELEGEYLTDTTDADLDPTDDLDVQRMLGRMRARLAGKTAPEKKPKVTATNAPEPPAHQVRGGSGQFEVSADTTDFAAFEKKVMGSKR